MILVAKACGVVEELLSVRSSSSSDSASHKSGGSSSPSTVTEFVSGKLCVDIVDGVKVQGEEPVEEGVVIAEVGVNTIARFGVAGGVAGTVGAVGSTSTVGC